jgi:hypothetical protein
MRSSPFFSFFVARSLNDLWIDCCKMLKIVERRIISRLFRYISDKLTHSHDTSDCILFLQQQSIIRRTVTMNIDEGIFIFFGQRSRLCTWKYLTRIYTNVQITLQLMILKRYFSLMIFYDNSTSFLHGIQTNPNVSPGIARVNYKLHLEL